MLGAGPVSRAKAAVGPRPQDTQELGKAPAPAELTSRSDTCLFFGQKQQASVSTASLNIAPNKAEECSSTPRTLASIFFFFLVSPHGMKDRTHTPCSGSPES